MVRTALGLAFALLGCGPNAASACPSGEAHCGGVCIDVQSDDSNCGGCALACSSKCSNGRCIVTLASGQSPTRIALDHGAVYWINRNDYSLARVPVGGGAITTIVTPHVGGAAGIAVDATSVYWLTLTGDCPPLPSSGTVMSATLQGGWVSTLAALEDESPLAIAVNSTNVYWSSISGVGTAGDPYVGHVKTVPLRGPPDGGSPTTLYSSRVDFDPNGLTIDDANIYLASNQLIGRGGVVLKLPLDGGTATTIAPAKNPWGVAVNGTSVSWTDEDAVVAAPLGGGATTTLASKLDGPRQSQWTIHMSTGSPLGISRALADRRMALC